MDGTTLPHETAPREAPTPPAVAGYAVLELVGRGGMGRVYRARHATLGRIVALKVLAHEPDERSLARFRDEARAVARLQHPSIAALYESGVVDGRPFLVQEFVAGGSLAEALAQRPLALEAAARIVEAVTRAVAYSHERGVLHRDLKPANILLTPEGTPKVTDFGLAKLLTTDDPSDDPSAPLTRTGEILGTPAYMAPEQASGVVSTIGPAVDVYALGAVLYESLTGRPPFQAPDPLQTLMMVLTMEPVAPRTLQPKIPRDLETICLKCLEKLPRRRYAGAAALADDLARWRAGEPIVARPVRAVERAWKWSRRRPWQVAALGLVGLGVTALAVGLAWATEKNRAIGAGNVQLARSNATLREANAQLDRSKAQVEGILNYTLATIEQYHFGLSDKLKDVPQGQALRVEVLDRASQTLDELDRLSPNRRQVWEYLTDSYSRLAKMQSSVSQLDRAVRSYERGRLMIDRLLSDRRGDPRLRANRAILGFELAAVLDRVGRPKDAAPLISDGMQTAANLSAIAPDEEGVLKLRIFASMHEAQTAMRAHDLPEVEAAYGRIAAVYRRLTRVDPANPDHAVAAADWDLSRSNLLVERGDLPAAAELIANVGATLPSLGASAPLKVRRVHATFHEAEATLQGAQGHPDLAEAAYRRAIALRTTLASDFPAAFVDRRTIVISWQDLARIWQEAGRKDRAACCLAEARTVAQTLVTTFPEDRQMVLLRDAVDQSIRELPPAPSPP